MTGLITSSTWQVSIASNFSDVSNSQNFATKCIAPNFEHNRSCMEEKDKQQRIIEATYIHVQ